MPVLTDTFDSDMSSRMLPMLALSSQSAQVGYIHLVQFEIPMLLRSPLIGCGQRVDSRDYTPELSVFDHR